MTIANFGQIVPLQMGILMLCGYRLTRERGMTEMLKSERTTDALEPMIEGHRTLTKVTKQDFGFSLAAWHAFLIKDEKAAKSYMRKSTWDEVERVVSTELRNPDRARLEALAAKEP